MNKAGILIIVLLAFVSCSNLDTTEKERSFKGVTLTTKQTGYVSAGHSFDFNFIQEVAASESKSWLVSPLSMQIMLGMLLNGAQGETAGQIYKALDLGTQDIEEINEFFLALIQQLPEVDSETDVAIANAVFVQDGFPIKRNFEKDVSNYYLADVGNLDFSKASAFRQINNWCNKHTQGLIPKIFEEKPDPNMMAILLNALYFKSTWAEKFPKKDTASETFYLESGKQTKVKMMKLSDKFFLCGENESCQVVSLIYGDERGIGMFAMDIILPKEGFRLSDVLAKMDYQELKGIHANSLSMKVDLWLPKFEIECDMVQNQVLSRMGMDKIFSNGDFSAFADGVSSFDIVKQKCRIIVDESGAEASAVTLSGLYGSPGPPRFSTFHADHPFLFIIREFSTEAILFAGCYKGD